MGSEPKARRRLGVRVRQVAASRASGKAERQGKGKRQIEQESNSTIDLRFENLILQTKVLVLPAGREIKGVI